LQDTSTIDLVGAIAIAAAKTNNFLSNFHFPISLIKKVAASSACGRCGLLMPSTESFSLDMCPDANLSPFHYTGRPCIPAKPAPALTLSFITSLHLSSTDTAANQQKPLSQSRSCKRLLLLLSTELPATQLCFPLYFHFLAS
jgi:hypothetical protein